ILVRWSVHEAPPSCATSLKASLTDTPARKQKTKPVSSGSNKKPEPLSGGAGHSDCCKYGESEPLVHLHRGLNQLRFDMRVGVDECVHPVHRFFVLQIIPLVLDHFVRPSEQSGFRCAQAVQSGMK